MPVKDFKKFLEISKVCNKTFGAASNGKSSTQSVIVKVIDDEMLSAMFVIVVNYASEGMWRELRKRWIEEGIESIKSTLKDAEEQFKTNTGKSLSLTIMEPTISDSLEMINYSMYNPKKTGYFRLHCNVKVD